MKLYDFSVRTMDNNLVSLQKYAGKVVLIVNTATGCTFTSQYAGLQALYDTYNSKGLEILDFPCNQFKEQASGTIDDINTFCTLNYSTTFPRFAKINVNGKDEHPLYQWLKQEKRGVLGGKIKWNFTKFLVDCYGNVAMRFAPTTDPSKIAKAIEKIL